MEARTILVDEADAWASSLVRIQDRVFLSSPLGCVFLSSVLSVGFALFVLVYDVIDCAIGYPPDYKIPFMMILPVLEIASGVVGIAAASGKPNSQSLTFFKVFNALALLAVLFWTVIWTSNGDGAFHTIFGIVRFVIHALGLSSCGIPMLAAGNEELLCHGEGAVLPPLSNPFRQHLTRFWPVALGASVALKFAALMSVVSIDACDRNHWSFKMTEDDIHELQHRAQDLQDQYDTDDLEMHNLGLWTQLRDFSGWRDCREPGPFWAFTWLGCICGVMCAILFMVQVQKGSRWLLRFGVLLSFVANALAIFDQQCMCFTWISLSILQIVSVDALTFVVLGSVGWFIRSEVLQTCISSRGATIRQNIEEEVVDIDSTVELGTTFAQID